MAKPSITLNNGAEMPAFGIGTWLSSPGAVGNAVKVALELGYRHIDCASFYSNENEVGEVFKTVFSSGTVKREEVFITSKLWVKDFDKVKAACKKSLKELCVDYLDLYLIHVPFELEADLAGFPSEQGDGVIGYDPERIWSVWKCMEELVEEGLVKSIGISNFTVKKTEEILKRSPKIIPSCNQCELHPYLPQKTLVEYCKAKGIVMVAYTSLGNPGRPDVIKSDDEKPLLSDEVVESIAKKHNVTNAQVLIAWGVARGTVVLVKSVSESRIKENLASLRVTLDEEDITRINAIEYRYRYLKQSWGLKAGETVEDLWDGEYLG